MNVHEWLAKVLDLHGDKAFMVTVNIIDPERDQLVSETYIVANGQEDTTVLSLSTVDDLTDVAMSQGFSTTLDVDDV